MYDCKDKTTKVSSLVWWCCE